MIYLVSNQTDAFEQKFTQISISEAISKLEKLKCIGNDTETSGLSCHTKKLLTIQLGNKDFQIVFDINSYNNRVPKELANFMNSYTGVWILQNAKFDLQFYYKQDIVLINIFDTMLAEYILTMGLQEKGRDLKTIVKKYCNVDLDKSIRGEIITKGLNWRVIQYAAFDVFYLEDVMISQLKEIKYKDLLEALTLDNKFVRVLAYLEYCGIKLDWEKWKQISLNNEKEVQTLKEKINDWLWDNNYHEYFDHYDLFSEKPVCRINWKSSKQVIPVFEKIGINCTIKEKGESKKTVEEKALKFQIDSFPILKLYFDYKAMDKVCSTYGLNWKAYINDSTKRVHSSFTQIMNTGRTSSHDPNIQNLPNNKETRNCFICDEGNKLIAIDFNGQESIVLANMANDQNLINFYKQGLEDMHSYVAYLLFPEIQTKPLPEINNDDLLFIKKNFHDKRQTAKTAEFAVAYGGDGSTIAKNTGCSKAQGHIVYNSYFKAFFGLKRYFDEVINNAIDRSYILYNRVTKRKFFIKHDNPVLLYADEYELGILNGSREYSYNTERAALQRLAQNYPIQGTSADISKLAGILFFNWIIKNKLFNIVKICNFVHDEYVIECPESMVDVVKESLINCMRTAGKYFCTIIPLDATAEVGDYWIH